MRISFLSVLGGMVAAAVATLAFAGSAWAVTLATPANNSATTDTSPNFSGTGITGSSGGSQTITVKVWTGATTSGTPLRSFTTTRSGSAWTVDLPSPTLGDGSYTGRAEQVVNGSTQVSSANLFRVDTAAPAPTITAPPSRTNDNTPTLAGAAGNSTGDSSTVTVRVYAGSTATGTPVQTLTPSRSGAAWSTTAST